ncbi:hypothetical protein [Demequina lignilytica]|uniref:ThiF family protein n=1 Tax=Demequina lignilytica TaxID=3051663 RepID=A0AB35MG34_9MICO|nr:hypothetical protein [Demequina sp. SYSU T0a273]MDN4482685.1 hypothetical protein [Demequina sp. SYSU T0a273]
MRLLPGAALLWRGGDRHQVGLARALPLDSDDARALARSGGAVPRDRPRLAARLTRAGLVAPEALAPARVRITGLSAPGVAAAEALARAGASLTLVDPTVDDAGTAEPGALPALGRGTRAERAARLVRELRPGVRVDLDRSRAVDSEVAVAVGSLPPVDLHRLMVADVPHVAVLVDERGVTLLPVTPGITACVRCRDIVRTRLDPVWPLLLRQCEPLAPRADPRDAAVAGALAAAAALALAGGGLPPGWRVEAGRPSPLPLAAEPACGCGAAERESDGYARSA